ncbi:MULTISPECIES: glycoside hydrolase family 5 protein [unclassified Pseudomonas]|uniref:glycoside hydrolase family 5 protein n=1 Tax=unclassified Pseudomonas TaxID=196821 RepID=UPI002AC991B7|nr:MULTISPECIES: glycoside hydrolase family 5 protein [unclassified Pseudomonas]MEB0039867.1 glycoside hydrolase family 5 protein [Pseudomonas sp. MH10]MEB0077191.1 glycoside hydrolase family 5 protein [Pseudomonas sp. MH10out]MEB0091478.1 glycoside hydrolase family 5 protein [Pseudomonas sp. CCI4.2]MEB0101538.1 glycoside hydrolase family 5 protein [Pseudomonas sp. CCI3.2]MEB0120649.1 glycoside hydrolase family 5 protein [Pseudomonas sp. CCI1.2]
MKSQAHRHSSPTMGAVTAFALMWTLVHGALARAETASLPMVLINVSGAEFADGVWPGKNGTNYSFPSEGFFAHWKAKGIRRVRFPVKWERLQPTLGGELDGTYASLIDRMLDQAGQQGVDVILDVHNSARYKNQVIGGPVVTVDHYRQLMQHIAQRWHSNPALYAYDLMNEPHDESDAIWPEAAQAGIDAIRTVDPRRLIIVEGRSWSSASRWPQYNDELLALKDPANHLVFSAHLYMDEDAGGDYKKRKDPHIDPDVGVKRVKPFIAWLQKNGRRGQIGEMGIPDDDPRWLEATDRLLGFLRSQCVPVAYWSAGEAWGEYRLAVEPINGRDRPQWPVLAKYLEAPKCTDYGPAPNPL